MIKYYYNDDGYFHMLCSGTVSTRDLIKILQEMENLTILPSLLKYLYDFREAELVIEPEDLPGLSQQSAKTCERCSNVKTAFIVEKPDNTALALLYTKENNYDKFNREIFSDPDAAINWLCGN